MRICKKTGKPCPLVSNIDSINNGDLLPIYAQEEAGFTPVLGMPGPQILGGFVILSGALMDQGTCSDGPGEETVTPNDNMGDDGWVRTLCRSNSAHVIDEIAISIFEVPVSSTYVTIPSNKSGKLTDDPDATWADTALAE